jgi:Fe-S oxidoreductase
MLSPFGKVLLLLLTAATAAAFLQPLLYRYRLIRTGRPENRFDRLAGRLARALGRVLFQRCTLKPERLFTGLMHVFIFYGALTFDTMTVNHVLEGFFDGFSLFGGSVLGRLFSFAVDMFGVLVLTGVAFLIIRRFLVRPTAYAVSRADSAVIYISLILVTLTYFYFEAVALAAHPGTERWSFLGAALARGILKSGPSAADLAARFQTGWWAHTLAVFGFIAYVPHSKYLHMLTGPLNLIFTKPGAGRALPALDLESAASFGLEKASDWSWKDNLDSLACMECGRCQDACPAYASGKPLSPRKIILDQKAHLLSLGPSRLANPEDGFPRLVPQVHGEAEIWSCTTCGACMGVCPVEIEHIPKIVGLRQGRVLAESAFPTELNGFFRGLESNSNPWNIGSFRRGEWAESMGVPTLAERPNADWLYWVGCAGSFDERGRAVSAALARLLRKAGLDFAVLGPQEKCCGDSARRLGQEYLFQTLALDNLAVLAAGGVRRIVTACPHGYNTLRNEYPALIDRVPGLTEGQRAQLRSLEVVHHTELLGRLMGEGRLAPRRLEGDTAWVYHDPCYLGRHNGVLEPPRAILHGLIGKGLRDLPRSGRHSFCCGAGGGLMWMEEKPGQRVGALRAEEIAGAGARMAATACPFCQTMLGDALREGGRSVDVKDIAQLLDEATD